MYGKHFEQMYTGSMYGQGFATFAVWGWIISHAQDGKVEINPAILSHIFGETESDIIRQIEYFLRPDPKSRTPDKDGRRLIRHGEYLYEVVNHAKYRKLAKESDRLEYKRDWDRKKRIKKPKPTESDTARQPPKKSDAPTHTEAYTDTKTKTEGEGISPLSFTTYWNSKKILPEIREFDDTRKAKLKTRLNNQYFAEHWREGVDRIAASAFCCGDNDRTWKADVNWFLKNDGVIVSVLEGKYDNNGKAKKSIAEQVAEAKARGEL